MSNHLQAETSPYLLQHADNPVDWHPWDEKTLKKASELNLPILLSIGYAACHWCHVMAHESFEDHDTAAVMNKLFINIKVDREERPDLDKIYQNAHYILTGGPGGWPLTVFLNPKDLTPFFSGTYFPPTPRYNLPAFKEILYTISDIYKNQHDKIEEQNKALLKILDHKTSLNTDLSLSLEPIALALDLLQRNYDKIHGGFGKAPKFPHAPVLTFLSINHSNLVIDTLNHIAQSGLYDQLGGGFFRYSVDAAWQIPHFEKMLYDNAQLLLLYAKMAAGESKFKPIVKKTVDWVIENLLAPGGGFYASFNADSEGEEGKFYVWNKSEIAKLLTTEEYSVIELYFGLNKKPNYKHLWHFTVIESLTSIQEQLKLSIDQINSLTLSAKQKLLAVRNQRIHPSCDLKILTSWNGLLITALFQAGYVLSDPGYSHYAEQTLAFIKKNLWIDGQLYATYQEGRPRFKAYLDDYAFLLQAILTKLQINWDGEYLQWATTIADVLLENFEDKKSGGFYFTANQHEKLIERPKSYVDDAMPSGNGVAIMSLLCLGYLLGETRYLTAAQKTLQSAWPLLLKIPSELCSLLIGLQQFINPRILIIIRGSNINEMQVWKNLCQQFNSDFWIFMIPEDEEHLPEVIALKSPCRKTCAYICKGSQCLDRIEDADLLQEILTNGIELPMH